MLGNLFYRRVAPSEIKAMGWLELRYWSAWHDKLEEEERPK